MRCHRFFLLLKHREESDVAIAIAFFAAIEPEKKTTMQCRRLFLLCNTTIKEGDGSCYRCLLFLTHREGKMLTFKLPLYPFTSGPRFKRVVLTATSVVPLLVVTFVLTLLTATSALPILATISALALQALPSSDDGVNAR